MSLADKFYIFHVAYGGNMGNFAWFLFSYFWMDLLDLFTGSGLHLSLQS